MNGKRVNLGILGFGKRGRIYAAYAKKHPDEFAVVAAADTAPERRAAAAREFGCPVFEDYGQLLASRPKADIIVVSTQDSDHPEHAIACMKNGYDILLEKPIASTEQGCLEIAAAAKKYNRKVVVCHVLRYTPFYETIKDLIDSGELGEIVLVSATENVGYYHQAHSFVRGPWRNSLKSCPMILAKCCHDMDILRWIVGEKCEKAVSFGSLRYFKKENAPQGAATRCSECPLTSCIYKAQAIYAKYHWMAEYFSDASDIETVMNDLKNSHYDRCVFACDNDVVDHQTSVFTFSGGVVASHTMTAFSREIYRTIKIQGTKAELVGVMEKNFIELRCLGGGVEQVSLDENRTLGNHGGGDDGLMRELYLVCNSYPSKKVTYLDVSMDSHFMAFAAERSRLSGKVESVKKI